MLGWQHVLVLLIGMAPEPDPAALVGQLGSAQPAQREAAARALQDLGAEALPALRAASAANNPNLRTRALALLDTIEDRLLTRPSLVQLDVQDQPLNEIAQEVGRQTGISLLFVPENDPLWKERRFTLRMPEPLPFWEALDQLSEVAPIRAEPGYQPTGKPGPTLYLFQQPGATRRSPFRVYSGPFRLDLISLHYYQDRSFVQPTGGESFSAHLQGVAEPRLNVTQTQELRLFEAVDDLGQSLLPGQAGQPIPGTGTQFGFNPGHNNFQFPVMIPLKHPEKAGRTIKTLRGVVPVVLSARKSDPLNIPLKDAKDKTFQHDGFTLIIRNVNQDPNEPRTTIDLSIQSPAGTEARIDVRRFEVVDDQGKPAQWFQSTSSQSGNEARMTMMVIPTEGVGDLASLRHYRLTQATAEAAFTFHDVPIP